LIAHPVGYYEDPSLKPAPARFLLKGQRVFVSQVVIKQNDIDVFLLQNGQCFAKGATAPDHPKLGLSLKQMAETFPEQTVIVNKQNPDGLIHSYHIGGALP
jgi:hypothetical protein